MSRAMLPIKAAELAIEYLQHPHGWRLTRPTRTGRSVVERGTILEVSLYAHTEAWGGFLSGMGRTHTGLATVMVRFAPDRKPTSFRQVFIGEPGYHLEKKGQEKEDL